MSSGRYLLGVSAVAGVLACAVSLAAASPTSAGTNEVGSQSSQIDAAGAIDNEVGGRASQIVTVDAARADTLSVAGRERALRSFTVAAVGDILPESPVRESAARFAGPGERFRFEPLFAPVRPILAAADLAICHMEIPIGYPGQLPGAYGRSPFGGNLLLAPYELTSALFDAGFDRCSTSSNHANDLGFGGIVSTLDALDAFGLSHHGTARTPEEATDSGLLVKGVAVTHLSYTRSSNTSRPPDWQMAFAPSPLVIAAQVAAARAAGAEVVIVSVHIGRELLDAPAPDDRAFVEQLTASADIDLVVEHGPHVLQPVETVNGTPVFWSVGNFVSGMGRPGDPRYGPEALDGLVATATFRELAEHPGRFAVNVEPVLVCNEITSRIVRPVSLTIADPATPSWLRGEMESCRRRGRLVVPQAT